MPSIGRAAGPLCNLSSHAHRVAQPKVPDEAMAQWIAAMHARHGRWTASNSGTAPSGFASSEAQRLEDHLVKPILSLCATFVAVVGLSGCAAFPGQRMSGSGNDSETVRGMG